MRHVAGATRPLRGAYDADIVILALGRPNETQAAIASALAQRGLSRHVTVLDQGSSAEALQRLAALIAGCDDATLLVAERNLGVPEGRNAVSAFGHGRVIIGLDNDAEFAGPDTAALAVAVMDGAPEIAALGFRIMRHGTAARRRLIVGVSGAGAGGQQLQHGDVRGRGACDPACGVGSTGRV